MPKKFLFAAVLLCACAPGTTAQEVAMDVPSLLGHIAFGNAEVRSARSACEVAEQGVATARSARLPHLQASIDLNYLGDGTILDRNFSNAMRDRLPHFGNTLSVTLYQPVYQGGAISAGIDIARRQSELAGIGISQTLDAMGVQALSSFFNLLKMRNLRNVYVENIAITRRLIGQMEEHYRQGTALRNDITRYELRLSSLLYDLQCIDNSISVLNNNLVSLMALPSETLIRPVADYSIDVRDEDFWQTITADQSHDLRAIDKTMEISKSALRLERAAMLPSVGIVAGNHFTGPITFEIPAVNKNYNAWFAGLSISYNISSLWTANKKIKQKRLEIANVADRRNSIAESLSRKVHEAFTACVQANQMLDTETVNVRLANENYAVVETRFHNDMALLTDMLDASTAKLDAETRLVNARINLLLSFYQLKFISGTLYSL